MTPLQINEESDKGSKQYKNVFKIFKVFNGVEYKGSVVGYSPKNTLYQLKYEEGDNEEKGKNSIIFIRLYFR